MSNGRQKPRPKGYLHENHPKPVSRRDFIAQGFMSGASYVILPSALGWAFQLKTAHAEDCSKPVSGVPCLIFDAIGGMAISQETAAWGKGGVGDFLSATAYRKLGHPDHHRPSGSSIDPNGVGRIAWTRESRINAGLKSAMSSAALEKTSGVLISSVLGDDTYNNAINPAHLIAKVAGGSFFPTVGTLRTPSGGGSHSTEVVPAHSAYLIESPESAVRLKDFKNLQKAAGGDASVVSKLLGRLQSLSNRQIQEFSVASVPAALKKVLDCAYSETKNLVIGSEGTNLDSRSDPKVTAIFNMADQEEARLASIAHLTMTGMAGVGVFTRGGADYHIGSRIIGDTYNQEIGALIGKCLSYAASLKKKVMIILVTDGSVSPGQLIDPNTDGYPVWSGDGGEYASNVIFAYDPDKAPEMRTHQLGWYNKDAGGVDRYSAAFANNPLAVGYTHFAHYLAFCGRLGEFASFVHRDNPLRSTSLQSIVAFGV